MANRPCENCIHEEACKTANPDMVKKTYQCKHYKSTADVVEVKHGEWILHSDGSGTCKICNTHQKDIWDMDNWQNFCGRCGAKMDGGNAE